MKLLKIIPLTTITQGNILHPQEIVVRGIIPQGTNYTIYRKHIFRKSLLPNNTGERQ